VRRASRSRTTRAGWPAGRRRPAACQPEDAASATSDRSGARAGSAAIAASAAPATSAARHQDRRLPAAVDQPAEQRPADAERHGEGARDDAGRGERAGQVRGVDEQADAEHGHRQARDDRDDIEAQSAGSRAREAMVARVGRHWFTDEGQLGP
jgi:hypothetical protein